MTFWVVDNDVVGATSNWRYVLKVSKNAFREKGEDDSVAVLGMHGIVAVEMWCVEIR